MENAQEILVIVLSSFLALSLLLTIVLLVLTIKVVKSIKRVTDKAEQLADKAEAFSDIVHKAATPLVLGKILSNLTDKAFGKRKSKK